MILTFIVLCVFLLSAMGCLNSILCYIRINLYCTVLYHIWTKSTHSSLRYHNKYALKKKRLSYIQIYSSLRYHNKHTTLIQKIDIITQIWLKVKYYFYMCTWISQLMVPDHGTKCEQNISIMEDGQTDGQNPFLYSLV